MSPRPVLADERPRCWIPPSRWILFRSKPFFAFSVAPCSSRTRLRYVLDTSWSIFYRESEIKCRIPTPRASFSSTSIIIQIVPKKCAQQFHCQNFNFKSGNNRLMIQIYLKFRGPPGPNFQFEALRASLTSSFAPFGRSGRVTQNLTHMLTCVHSRLMG